MKVNLADALVAPGVLRPYLLNWPDIVRYFIRSVEADAGPVLPMQFRKGDMSLQLFTTIATLGTPRDITVQELRLECFFPMDPETAAVFQRWAM